MVTYPAYDENNNYLGEYQFMDVAQQFGGAWDFDGKSFRVTGKGNDETIASQGEVLAPIEVTTPSEYVSDIVLLDDKTTTFREESTNREARANKDDSVINNAELDKAISTGNFGPIAW